jgi:hypothetical protein
MTYKALCIMRRLSGKEWITLCYNNGTPKTIVKSLTAKTREEALAKLNPCYEFVEWLERLEDGK